jgi:hypothetical protein
MRYRIQLLKDGRVEVIRYIRNLDEIPDWVTEWKHYNQLKGDWEIRITPEEA